jgi:hypothetical protein
VFDVDSSGTVEAWLGRHHAPHRDDAEQRKHGNGSKELLSGQLEDGTSLPGRDGRSDGRGGGKDRGEVVTALRILVQYLLLHPVLLFSLLGITAVVLAVGAFVVMERRARRMAELAEDEEAMGGQKKRIAIVATTTIALLVTSAWWVFFRVHTEPDHVLVAITVDTGDGSAPRGWWDGDAGSLELAIRMDEELQQLGLIPVPTLGDDPDALEGAESKDDVLAAAARLNARWVLTGTVRVDHEIPLEGADFQDYVMRVEAQVVDTQTGEAFDAPGLPLRVFLWGESPSAAVSLNGKYIAKRLAMPMADCIGQRDPLERFRGNPADMTYDDQLAATRLEPLFLRVGDYDEGLEQRAKDEEKAVAQEAPDAGDSRRTRMGTALAEEYFIGAAADGRVVMLTEPKFIGASPDKLGYVITSEGENLMLVAPDGQNPELLFEHYNIYSAPSVSADGTSAWLTVANHGASKTLARISIPDGKFEPLLTHRTQYNTSPLPSPDGSRAVFYTREGRRAPQAIAVMGLEGEKPLILVGENEDASMPTWSADGKSVYVAVGEPWRIISIDAESGARQHVIGMDPHALPEPNEGEEEATDVAPADEELPVPDPKTSSAFRNVAASADGQFLFVAEVDLDGQHWVGRHAVASGEYVRLAPLRPEFMLASPTENRVAFTAGWSDDKDEFARDLEVLVLGPQPGDPVFVTRNDYHDELGGWSGDGKSVYTHHRSRDPGNDRKPVVRVYRHEL